MGVKKTNLHRLSLSVLHPTQQIRVCLREAKKPLAVAPPFCFRRPPTNPIRLKTEVGETAAGLDPAGGSSGGGGSGGGEPHRGQGQQIVQWMLRPLTSMRSLRSRGLNRLKVRLGPDNFYCDESFIQK